ncbi:cytochrome c oxidase subunit I [Variovorax sp. KK3]|uniref:cytochrome c oxidase subunit I n=1 Tax=Variovorax sp. KK3 TaxID=1855728 RepID=UPI00117CF0FB|nr:cytochrome c oxidase subunit I [Variovorax sp. KK3]
MNGPLTSERLPSDLPRPAGEREALERAWRAPQGWRLLSAVNNTHIGAFYIVAAMVFFVLAGVLGLLIRAQLAVPDNTLIGPGTYNQLFTMHGTVMMFLFAVPVVEAVAVYLLPGMLGARDLPFPRLSAYAFWAYAIGGLVFFGTLFFGQAPDGGWFMYPPLTGKEFSPGRGADWWLLGIGFIEISAIAGAIELIIGILFTRAPGMTLMRMPVFAWAMLVTALMIVFAFPAVIAATTLLELERAFDWPFFIAERGGDPVLWQHLFWFFGHPEVYIIFLPAAGMVSMMVATLAGTPLVGYRAIVAALAGVGLLSFALWVHHMFAVGLGALALTLTSAASFAVAIPSGVQVFAWIATFWRGQVKSDTPTLFLLGFHFIFVLGGLTGVMVAVLPFDWQAHDSYFIVAHLHYVLIGGMVFPLFAGFYYWAPIFNGHRLSERWGRWVFGLMFGGFNLAFFPMHISGLMGMPRRIYTYPGDLGWNTLNMLSTLGAFVLAAGVLLFFIDAIRTLRRPEQDHGNPWNAGTLEWLPPRDYGVRSIPQVQSREPLWRQPELPREVEEGRHWLPGTAFGGRETLVTSVVDARPLHLLRLPTDGWPPFLAAAGTAGFFLLLTAELMVPAFACGLGAVGAIVWWLWQSDQPPPASHATVATGVQLPVGSSHWKNSHSWWAMIVLLAVDMTVFACFAYSHLHVSMAADVCPPPGAALPPVQRALASGALLLAGSLALGLAARRLREADATRQRGLRALVVVAMLCALAGFGIDLDGHRQAGLNPSAEGWSASVALLLAYQGFHMVVLMLMGSYLLVRSWTGRLQPSARATLDNTAPMWHGTTAQGLIALLLVQALPRLLG